MKKNIIFAALIALYSFLTACNGSPQKETASAATGAEKNSITFQVNGEPVQTDGWNISRFAIGDDLNLNITTDMHTDKRTVMLNLRGCAPGTYALGTEASGPWSGYGDYKSDYSDLLTSYRFEKGSFTITQIDTVKGVLNASFSGTVRRGSEVLQITDGRITNGALKTTVQTY